MRHVLNGSDRGRSSVAHLLPLMCLSEMAMSTIAWSCKKTVLKNVVLLPMRFDFLRRANFTPSDAARATREEATSPYIEWGTPEVGCPVCVHDGRRDGRTGSHAFFHSRRVARPKCKSSHVLHFLCCHHASPLSHPEFTLLSPFLSPSLRRLPRVGNLDKYTRVRHDEEDVWRIGGEVSSASDKRPRLENCLALLAPSVEERRGPDGRKREGEEERKGLPCENVRIVTRTPHEPRF